MAAANITLITPAAMNQYNPSNPYNPLNQYNPKNPLNPLNEYNPSTPFQPLNSSPRPSR